MLPTTFIDPPLLHDPMGVCLQGVQQAQVGASHASLAPLGIAYGRSGLVGVQSGCALQPPLILFSSCLHSQRCWYCSTGSCLYC